MSNEEFLELMKFDFNVESFEIHFNAESYALWLDNLTTKDFNKIFPDEWEKMRRLFKKGDKK